MVESVKCLPSAQVMILGVLGLSPTSGSLLSLLLLLPLPLLLLMFSLILTEIRKYNLFFFRKYSLKKKKKKNSR